MKKRIYHLQDKDDVEMTGIEKKSIVYQKGTRNSISSTHIIRCNSDLSVEKSTVRRISCLCTTCIE